MLTKTATHPKGNSHTANDNDEDNPPLSIAGAILSRRHFAVSGAGVVLLLALSVAVCRVWFCRRLSFGVVLDGLLSLFRRTVNMMHFVRERSLNAP